MFQKNQQLPGGDVAHWVDLQLESLCILISFSDTILNCARSRYSNTAVTTCTTIQKFLNYTKHTNGNKVPTYTIS